MTASGLKRLVKPVVSRVLTGVLGNDQGLVKLTTRNGPAKGLRFRLDLERRLEYAYWFGNYERAILEQVAVRCRPGFTVWDCGTYLGYYTCIFARLVGPSGRVVAFEPDSGNLERTKQNAALNGFSNVAFEHTAIGAPCGEIDLLVSATSNSHIPGVYVGADREAYAKIERVESMVRVRCTSLDEACGRLARPDLIKIDIEGAEQIALQYTSRLCREVRPFFILELHNDECDQAAWDWSRANGYTLTSLTTGKGISRREETGGTLWCEPVTPAMPRHADPG